MDKHIKEIVKTIFDRVEKEIKYDATHWNGMFVWEAGDADTFHQILTDALTTYRQQVREETLNDAINKFGELQAKADNVRDLVYLDGIIAVLKSLRSTPPSEADSKPSDV